MTIVEKEKCCACRACVQVCPKDAISTIYDEYGFERISVDEEKCVSCGLCKTVCPIINPRKVHGRTICGSAYSKDKEVKLNGSSGGLFGVFARAIIDEGGVVYGAAFNSQLHLLTTKAQDVSQLKQLYKSKYLLCDTCDSFKQIEND